MGKPTLPQNLHDWVEARKRHHLSHAHVQMARELGIDPKKLGKIDNHDQEPWKRPLPEFIEHLYLKTFGKARPEVVMSIEDRARLRKEKKAERKAAKRQHALESSAAAPFRREVGYGGARSGLRLSERASDRRRHRHPGSRGAGQPSTFASSTPR